MADRKLFAGPRLRRLRKSLSLSQAGMAEELGLSASYLNLMERNQRPITAQVLLKLAETYEIDLKELGSEPDGRMAVALREVAGDPLMESLQLDRQDLTELLEAHPRGAEALIRLHGAYRDSVRHAADLSEHVAERDGPVETGRAPMEEVREALHQRNNYFPQLEEAAETLVAALAADPRELEGPLRDRLKRKHKVVVKLMPLDVMRGALARFDRHSRRLFLNETLSPSTRIFQLVYHLALLELRGLLDEVEAAGKLSTKEARKLYRISLANYLAGAVMMPYGPFLKAAEELRYDLEILGQRFGAGFEQVCHRLTTLNRPGRRGVPFFMIRVDHAGNVSKRFGGRVFHFTRSGGACPRWRLYEAFRQPGRILAQPVALPDGASYFTISRTVERPGAGWRTPGQMLAIGLGCEAAQAHRLVYADGLDLEQEEAFTPIGVNCRLCERADCNQRAFPPVQRRLFVDEHYRGASPFSFRED